MLLVPTVLTSATIWFTVPEMRRRRARSKAARQQKVAEAAPADLPLLLDEEAGQT